MKIGVLNRDPLAHPGGDVIHIQQLSKALRRRGVERTYLREWTPESLRAFDLVHIYHVNFGWSRINFEGVLKSGVPYIVTTIFYPTDKLGVGYREIQAWLEKARAVVSYSHAEALEIEQLTSFPSILVTLIPPGASRDFRAYFSLDRELVIADAARIGDKNTHLVERACRDLHLPFRLVQGLAYEDLPPIYKVGRVFVNASGSERFGLSIIQGLASGCRVLATKYSRGLEWFPGIEAIDPLGEDLTPRIERAYHAEHWNWEPNRIARLLTWNRAAGEYRTLYERALV